LPRTIDVVGSTAARTALAERQDRASVVVRGRLAVFSANPQKRSSSALEDRVF